MHEIHNTHTHTHTRIYSYVACRWMVKILEGLFVQRFFSALSELNLEGNWNVFTCVMWNLFVQQELGKGREVRSQRVPSVGGKMRCSQMQRVMVIFGNFSHPTHCFLESSWGDRGDISRTNPFLSLPPLVSDVTLFTTNDVYPAPSPPLGYTVHLHLKVALSLEKTTHTLSDGMEQQRCKLSCAGPV
jgi:hypothetical protein